MFYYSDITSLNCKTDAVARLDESCNYTASTRRI